MHEIESGYEKEWEILKMPVKITGFLILHIPILFIIFYGFFCIIKYPQTKLIISIVMGSTGFIPFIVHKIIVKRKEHFNKTISNILIFGNIITGSLLIIFGIIEKNV